MGNDGERLVMDYLSRVGDLAHGTSLSAVERRDLVTRVRNEIGEQRSAVPGDESTGDVKRILRRLGRPEDVVAAAGAEPPESAAAVPSAGQAAPADTGPERPAGQEGGPADAADGPEVPVPRAGGGPAGVLDPNAPEPPAGHGAPREDWPDGRVGGFVGGIIDPELLRPSTTPERAGGPGPGAAPAGAGETAPAATTAAPPGGAPGTVPPQGGGSAGGSAAGDRDGAGGGQGAPPGGAEAAGAGPVAPLAPPKERGALARRGVRLVSRSVGGRHVGGVVEFAAVAALVAGAVLPSLYALIAGWLLAYWAPRMSRPVAKTTVFVMPGVVVGSYVTWLVGRVSGYWGEPLEGGAIQTALGENYGMLLQLSAVASAAFLLWRAGRRPKG